MLIDLYLQGRLPLDKFVTEKIAIDDIEAAFDEDAPRRGAALGRGDVSARIERVGTSGGFASTAA